MPRFIPESEHNNSMTHLYKHMQVGDEARVLRPYRKAYPLLTSVWRRLGEKRREVQSKSVPWLYLEPAVARVNGEVIEATMVIRVADREECWAMRKKFLKEGVT